MSKEGGECTSGRGRELGCSRVDLKVGKDGVRVEVLPVAKRMWE